MSNLPAIKNFLQKHEVIERFEKMLGKEESATYMSSIINIVSNSNDLQKCSENSIMIAAFKAAALKLPIDPMLGRAYIIPYGTVATFQIGYKGLRELAIRSGIYKKIKVSEVYADELEYHNPITGETKFTEISKWQCRYDGKSEPVGYYAFFVTHSGLEEELYMTKKQVEAHATKFSQAYKAKKKDSPWFTNFDKMGKKTVLKLLLADAGILSVEMRNAFVDDSEPEGNIINNNPDNEPIQEAPQTTRRGKTKKEEVVVDAVVEAPAETKPEAPADEKDPFDD